MKEEGRGDEDNLMMMMMMMMMMLVSTAPVSSFAAHDAFIDD